MSKTYGHITCRLERGDSDGLSAALFFFFEVQLFHGIKFGVRENGAKEEEEREKQTTAAAAAAVKWRKEKKKAVWEQ